MAKLVSREMFIPGGFQFVQPETNWRPRRMSSFVTIVNALIAHRNANPFLRDKHHWATDPESVANEVEQFNVRLCQSMGWTKYVTGDPGGAGFVPKPAAPSQRSASEVSAVAAKARKIWAGVRTLNDWIDSNEPAVPAGEAERRAAVCVACPLNGQGGLERFFTAPASEAIKRQFEKLSERKLTTTLDEKLNVCTACFCPLRLKVHTPAKFITANLSPGVLEELKGGNNCWILALSK